VSDQVETNTNTGFDIFRSDRLFVFLGCFFKTLILLPLLFGKIAVINQSLCHRLTLLALERQDSPKSAETKPRFAMKKVSLFL